MSDCIIWKGKTWSQGRYGYLYINGRTVSAHRQAWMEANGEIPKGFIVCHKCDNGLCVNPEHLFIGTPKDNMQDCKSKGRLRVPPQAGIYNGNANKEIISKYKEIQEARKQGMSLNNIRKKYGLKSNGHVYQILNRDLADFPMDK